MTQLKIFEPLTELKLVLCKHIPRELEPGILYVSLEYGAALHLCACGWCGWVVSTPIAPTEWTFEEVNGKATLHPSIGNHQFPCRSHYWIKDGKIVELTFQPKA